MTRSSRTFRSLVALAALAMAAVACGDDDDAAETGGAPSTTAPAADEATTTSAAAEEAPTDEAPPEGEALVEVATTDLGDIVVSGGMTVYAFLPDEGGTPTCYDQCAQTWPPLLAEGDITTGAGLDAAAFTTATRDDGGEQVLLNGWPLYFFASDAAPGDTNGQGVGDNWFVVGIDGEPVRG